MPIIYKVDILTALKEKGYSTYRLRKDKLLAESTVQALRRGDMVSLDNISRICTLLECQPGDIMAHLPDDTGEVGGHVKEARE